MNVSDMMSKGQLNDLRKIYRIVYQVVEICAESHKNQTALVNIGPHTVYLNNEVI